MLQPSGTLISTGATAQRIGPLIRSHKLHSLLMPLILRFKKDKLLKGNTLVAYASILINFPSGTE